MAKAGAGESALGFVFFGDDTDTAAAFDHGLLHFLRGRDPAFLAELLEQVVLRDVIGREDLPFYFSKETSGSAARLRDPINRGANP